MDDALDLLLLIGLLVFFFLMLEVISLIRNLNDVTLDDACKKGPSVSLKKDQITGTFQKDIVATIALAKYGSVPANDLTVRAKLKCE